MKKKQENNRKTDWPSGKKTTTTTYILRFWCTCVNLCACIQYVCEWVVVGGGEERSHFINWKPRALSGNEFISFAVRAAWRNGHVVVRDGFSRTIKLWPKVLHYLSPASLEGVFLGVAVFYYYFLFFLTPLSVMYTAENSRIIYAVQFSCCDTFCLTKYIFANHDLYRRKCMST